MKYVLVIETAEEGFCAYFPDVPGCTTAGETIEAVRHNAIEALAGHLEGEELPSPRPLKAILDEGLEVSDGTELFAFVEYEPTVHA